MLLCYCSTDADYLLHKLLQWLLSGIGCGKASGKYSQCLLQ